MHAGCDKNSFSAEGDPASATVSHVTELDRPAVGPDDEVGQDEESPQVDRRKSTSAWVKASLGALLFLGVVVLLSFAFSDDDDEQSDAYEACEAAARRNGIDPSTPEGLAVIGRCMAALESGGTAKVRNGDGRLSVTDACRAFYRIVADVTMTDEESSAAYSSLAARTDDANLAAEIGDVAQSFANHDAEVSSVGVNAICQ